MHSTPKNILPFNNSQTAFRLFSTFFGGGGGGGGGGTMIFRSVLVRGSIIWQKS